MRKKINMRSNNKRKIYIFVDLWNQQSIILFPKYFILCCLCCFSFFFYQFDYIFLTSTSLRWMMILLIILVFTICVFVRRNFPGPHLVPALSNQIREPVKSVLGVLCLIWCLDFSPIVFSKWKVQNIYSTGLFNDKY